MASSFNKFNAFVANVANGAINLGSDTLKVMLSNVAPVATNSVKSDITEISAGNGYTAGGTQATLISSTQSGGIYTLSLNNVVFTASGGSIATFRYAVLYDSTAATSPLIGYFDYGSAVNVNSGETLTVQWSGSGVLTLQ
jgi:hypothetical protein